MTILKLVRSKFVVEKITYCHNDIYEVTVRLTGLDFEDCDTLKRIYKEGWEVQIIPVDGEEEEG